MSAPGSLFDARPHTWTLPLAPGRWAYIQLPSRCIDEEEWEQLHTLLAIMKQGLVTEREAPDQETEPVVEAALEHMGGR